MSLEILSQVNNQFQSATAFHRESADLMWFISLDGFAALHELQYAEESQTQRRLKQYILITYRTPVYDDAPTVKNIFKDQMDGKDRKNLTGTDKWQCIQAAWIAYEKWESDTLTLYEQCGKQLIDAGHMADYEALAPIIRDVSAELRNVSDILNAMQGMDFDLPTITSMQPELQEKYQKKLHNFNKGAKDD